MLKRGDMVFFRNRKPIGKEINDVYYSTSVLEISLNRVYTVSARIASMVHVYGCTNWYHIDHFIKIEQEEIQGINILKKGDIVELVDKDPKGIELGSTARRDYLRSLEIGKYYIVYDYRFTHGEALVRIEIENENWYSGMLCLNYSHFKKIIC